MEKKAHAKKMIAPAVVTAISVLYYAGFAAACIFLPGFSLPGRLICGILPLLLAAVAVYVFIERIKEIRSGEEDDLSQY